MNLRREPYSPAQAAKKIHGLRLAAERLEREEFEGIANPPPVQLRFPFAAESRKDERKGRN